MNLNFNYQEIGNRGSTLKAFGWKGRREGVEIFLHQLNRFIGTFLRERGGGALINRNGHNTDEASSIVVGG